MWKLCLITQIKRFYLNHVYVSLENTVPVVIQIFRISANMHHEEDDNQSDIVSCNLTPEKLHRTPRDSGSCRKETKTHSQELKRKIHYTSQNSPHKFQKTPQCTGSFRKDTKSLSDSSKRKGQSSQYESLEKIQKISPGGKFVNTLIGQWSKHTGIQTPLSHIGVQESPMTEEMKRMYVIEERKIQLLQKKLQAAEETISSLSTSREAESRAKEEILRQLNADWESITKYYCEISESLKEFQQQKDNLSALYNDIILKQQTAMKKLQQDLSNMRLKDEEQKNIVATVESKVISQEKKIQDMTVVESELKKQLEDAKTKAILEKNRLDEVHAEERSELMKKQEKLTSVNEELQQQLKKIVEEKQNLTNLFEEKNKEISKLQEEISMYKNKIEYLLDQNAELGIKYEKSIGKEGELTKQLESKDQEITRLRENLSARQEIESSLANDLELIENKYKAIENDFKSVENKLQETQARNSNLERTLQNMSSSNDHAITDLHKKIQILEKEKEKILSEKHAKIKELENSCNSLEKKYKLETTALKKDFDKQLSEMKKTMDTQNSAFIKLNENFNKMNEEHRKRRLNYENEKENQNLLKEKMQLVAEPNLIETNRTYLDIGSQEKGSQTYETKQKEYRDDKKIDTPKVTSKNTKDKSDVEDQDIYNFNPTEVDEFTQLLSQSRQKRVRYDLHSPTRKDKDKDVIKSNIELQAKEGLKAEDSNKMPQKKKIFKTRETGLRQYGSQRKINKK
ncbi:uncharacterized protein LOC143178537 [Calliopsis andreniformis]|uniref:uncharacterized protein LOC143178537 n=1 Tax=Calliopsis andreniformis TaxID=337506 RepID=UPI003FCDCCB9